VQVGGGGAVDTVSGAVAKCVVSMVPINRWFEVFVYGLPATLEAVTPTEIVQLLFAPTVPLEKLMLVAPANGEKVGVPQPFVEATAGLATVTFVGKRSVKL